MTATSRYLKGWIHTKLRTSAKRINTRRPGHRNHADYHLHRFPDITRRGLEERVDRLGRQLGRFGRVRVRQASRHVFHIHQ